MYMSTVNEVWCGQVIEQGLSFEEIQALAKKRSTMLWQWMPETMSEVEERARIHRHNIAMRAWYKGAPNV